jgi:hypothetical protein
MLTLGTALREAAEVRLLRIPLDNEGEEEHLRLELIFEGWLERRAQMEARVLLKARREKDTASLLERLRNSSGTPCLLSVGRRQPQVRHIPHYLDALRWQKRYSLHRKHTVAALATLAQKAPSPELQDALPFLTDFPDARRILEAALLPNAVLPIPAQLTNNTDNLPRPTDEDTGQAASLPTPAAAPEGKAPRKAWWKWWVQ